MAVFVIINSEIMQEANSPGNTVTVPDAGEGAGAVLAINLVVSTPISPTSLFCLEWNSIPLG